MSIIIKTIPGTEAEVGDVILSIPAHTVVMSGEYAAEGEPDVLVRVMHAVDEDGNDTTARVAKQIARALAGPDEREEG